MRALNLVKEHAAWGYYFDLKETSFYGSKSLSLEQLNKLFSYSYKSTTQLYHLKVFRDKEDKRPCKVQAPNDNPPLTAEAKLMLERLFNKTSFKELLERINATVQGHFMKSDEEYQVLVKQVTYRVKQALNTFKDEPEHIRQQLNKLVLQEIVASLNGTKQVLCVEGDGLVTDVKEPGQA